MNQELLRSRSSKGNTLFYDNPDDPQTSSENAADSPLSGDDSKPTPATSPSPKKRSTRRSIKKRVVTVPIRDTIDGSNITKGEAYPPSDSWSWRKYGQKPIKGSPYPRGYYRCSSSKGCPARKQVERSHADPTMLIITYASDHSHSPHSSSSKHHPQPHPRHHTPVTVNDLPQEEEEQEDDNDEEQSNLFGSNQQADKDLMVLEDSFLGSELSWLSDVTFYAPPVAEEVGHKWEDADMAGTSIMREEDESLFADLGELPECSTVFRHGRRRDMSARSSPLCGDPLFSA